MIHWAPLKFESAAGIPSLFAVLSQWASSRLPAAIWLFSLLQGSIISSPHMRRRPPSSRDCPSRHSGQSLPSSASLLGSLFGTRRVKSPSPTPQPIHPPLIFPPPHPPNLHHTARVETDTPVSMHHAQFCHVAQNPPPYHHHHHYHPPAHLQHPPHQYHPASSHGQQAPYPPHSQHSHGSHSAHSSHPAHGSHHHGPPPAPTQATGSTKPKHSGISTVVWAAQGLSDWTLRLSAYETVILCIVGLGMWSQTRSCASFSVFFVTLVTRAVNSVLTHYLLVAPFISFQFTSHVCLL